MDNTKTSRFADFAVNYGFRMLRTAFWLTLLFLASLQSLKAADTPTLRFGVLPDADSLPFLVADSEGLFGAQGLNVALTLFKSPVERDAAFQAGAVDGIVGDTLGAAFAADNGFKVAITSLTDGRYGLLAAPGSGIASPKDLAGVPVGTSTNTIIQFFIDTTLTGTGLSRSDIRYLAVPLMPLRLEMLLSGRVKAAALPEPLLSVARSRGAVLLAGSDATVLAAGVVLFTRAAIDARRADLLRFYAAYAEAALRINADNGAYRDFLVKRLAFPEEIRDSYKFVAYAPARLPGVADVEAVLAWLRGAKLLKNPLVARDLLAPEVLNAGR